MLKIEKYFEFLESFLILIIVQSQDLLIKIFLNLFIN